MPFTLTIETDNAAFRDDPSEVARILREVARKIQHEGKDYGTIMDVNGNKVGEFSF